MLQHHVLIDEKAIHARVQELSQKIAADIGGKQPIVLGLLRGSFVFLADLVRALSQWGVEPKVDFLAVSHYGMNTDPARSVRIEKDTTLTLSKQAVLVVDDILDSGLLTYGRSFWWDESGYSL